MSYPLKLKGQNFQLHASGAVFWKEKSCLLISDVHLGKVTHFRKFGAALPRHAVHKNYLLLDRLVSYYQPFEICFLGDLFHSSLNKEWVLFENWMARTPSKITLIQKNRHQRQHPKPNRTQSQELRIHVSSKERSACQKRGRRQWA